MTDDLTTAIGKRMADSQRTADEQRHAFTPDPDLEQAAARIDELRELDPEQYRTANLGDLRTRVQTYQRRKARHEEQTR